MFVYVIETLKMDVLDMDLFVFIKKKQQHPIVTQRFAVMHNLQ